VNIYTAQDYVKTSTRMSHYKSTTENYFEIQTTLIKADKEFSSFMSVGSWFHNRAA